MDVIAENLKRINHNISEAKAKYRKQGDSVRLMAVTKTIPYDMVNRAIELGVDLIGENRVQEYLSKKEHYVRSAEVHFIGHLQTNKVKSIVGEVSLIQSADSLKLIREIDIRSAAKGINTDILIEVNIGLEESKSGVYPDGIADLLNGAGEFKNTKIRGLMAIPPFDNPEYWFEKMNMLFCGLKNEYPDFDTLSMGMSDDYIQAVKHGSNIVRIGSALFGARR